MAARPPPLPASHGTQARYRYGVGGARDQARRAFPAGNALGQRVLVWGESDRLIPPVYAPAWQALVPGAELVTIGEAGHMLVVEQPEAVAGAVEKFFG